MTNFYMSKDLEKIYNGKLSCIKFYNEEQISNLVNNLKDGVTEKSIESYVSKTKQFFFENDDFIIRGFNSVKEVLRESVICRNAICYFINKLGKQENLDSYIFILRSKEEPEKPFVSMMFDNKGEIAISSGMKELVYPHNTPVKEPEILEFVSKFSDEILKPFIKEKKTL